MLVLWPMWSIFNTKQCPNASNTFSKYEIDIAFFPTRIMFVTVTALTDKHAYIDSKFATEHNFSGYMYVIISEFLKVPSGQNKFTSLPQRLSTKTRINVTI